MKPMLSRAKTRMHKGDAVSVCVMRTVSAGSYIGARLAMALGPVVLFSTAFSLTWPFLSLQTKDPERFSMLLSEWRNWFGPRHVAARERTESKRPAWV